MPQIHPSAIVSDESQLADDVVVGPGCIIEGPVTLASGVKLLARVHLRGPLEVGADTTFFPGAVIGMPPQDFKVAIDDPTAGVKIGQGCTFREYVTIHAATSLTTPTTIGDRAYLMVTCHVGHDCHLGDDVLFVNAGSVSGHVIIEDSVTISGLTAVHQFVRIGTRAFLSGGLAVSMDIPPYCRLDERNRIGGINVVGMRRAGISRADITTTLKAFKDVFRLCLQRDDMITELAKLSQNCPPVAEMHRFVLEPSKKGICPGASRPPRMLAAWLNLRKRGLGESIDAQHLEV